MQDSVQNSPKFPTLKGDGAMIQKSRVLIKIGEILLNQGMLTLEEKRDFERMAQEQL